MLTLLTFLISPFIIFFSSNFDKSFGKYTEIVMKEPQNADSLSEETFRDIKTVMSLGAEEKFITRYWRIVKACCKSAIICTTKSGIHYSGMGLSTQLADGLLFLSAVLNFINHQRSDFPSLLFCFVCFQLHHQHGQLGGCVLPEPHNTARCLHGDLESCEYLLVR